MFFVLSKILRYFIYPLDFCLLVALVSFLTMKKWPKWAKRVLAVDLAVLAIVSTGACAEFLLWPLERWSKPPALPDKVDAIVVLSGMVDLRNSQGNRIEFGPAVDRIIGGIQLARKYPGALLILSGGSGRLLDRSHPEAPILRRFAIEEGIDPDRILIDDKSRNTHENAVESKKLLNARDCKIVVLVTSASHMPRAKRCFAKVGVDCIPYPVDFCSHKKLRFMGDFIPSAGSLYRTSCAIKEYVGLVMYRIVGYI